MLIYADTNIYSRPFDEKNHSRIILEIEACLMILETVRRKKLSCISSDILKLEIERTNPAKKMYIKPLIGLCEKHISQTEKLIKLADNIYKKCNIAPRDSLHIASGAIGKVQYFLTCDDGLIRKQKCIEKNFSLKVINPVQFISNIF